MEQRRLTLAAARVNAGYTKREAAKLLGVTPNAIYRWENNLNNPRPNRAKMMAELYGISLDDVFFAKDREKKSHKGG